MFKVQKRMCATCIYRPDSALDLKRLEADVADPYLKGHFKGHRACHHAAAGDVCCRGFWNKHKDNFDAGQLAQRLNVVEFVDVDTEERMSNKSKHKGEQRRAKARAPEAKRAPMPQVHGYMHVEGKFLCRQCGWPEEYWIHQGVQRTLFEPPEHARRDPSTIVRQRPFADATAAPLSDEDKRVREQYRKHVSKLDTRQVVLEPNPPEDTAIQEGSLRAALLEALRAGRGTMTVEELSAALKRDAKPVINKLAQKGFLKLI